MSDRFREWAAGRRGRDHSRRVYDWWSRHDRAYGLFVDAFLLGRTDEFRRRTVEALALEPGDSVLDAGCGPGPNFELLADAVGSEGTVVGVDASPGMVTRASERGETLAPETAVLGADAATLPLRDARFDAACATLSLSAVPDVPAVVDGLHDALRPGGRLAVLDARSFESGPLRWLDPLVEGVAAALTNWYPDAPVVESVGETFAEVTVEAHYGGTIYLVTGRKDE